MKGLILNWDSAHAVAQDAAFRNMRARRAKNPRLRERLSAADHNVYVATLERLAVTFYRANVEDVYGPVDLREAWMTLAETKGQGCRVARSD